MNESWNSKLHGHDAITDGHASINFKSTMPDGGKIDLKTECCIILETFLPQQIFSIDHSKIRVVSEQHVQRSRNQRSGTSDKFKFADSAQGRIIGSWAGRDAMQTIIPNCLRTRIAANQQDPVRAKGMATASTVYSPTPWCYSRKRKTNAAIANATDVDYCQNLTYLVLQVEWCLAKSNHYGTKQERE
eukprot:scaffold1690_cov182-Amphora_coffeaeformis.AAC.75